MFKPTIQQIRAVLATKKYKFFEGGLKPYDLNIIGIRSASNIVDYFNETLLVIYKNELGEEKIDYFHYTSKPGLYYLKNPLNPKGCAITAEGQHRGVLKKRKHRGKYNALCQFKSIPHYRDNDLDDQLELTGKIYKGIIGLNIHRESPTKVSKRIGKYSAGCGVILAEFDYFMWLVDQGIKNWGNQFTYTLLNERDFYGLRPIL